MATKSVKYFELVFLSLIAVSYGGKFVDKTITFEYKVKPTALVPPPGTTVTPVPVTVTAAPPVTVSPFPNPTITPAIRKGIGCGTIVLGRREIVKIQSNNFLQTNYPNNDACTWKFIGRACTLKAECPCFDVASSFNCIEDYLKFMEPPFNHQKFCGANKPPISYRASSDSLSIRFRSNKSYNAKGFACYVQCVAPGERDLGIEPNPCPADF